MDYTDIEKLKAINAAAKARLLIQQVEAFWLKLKTNDPNTTPEYFDQVVQLKVNELLLSSNDPKTSETDFDTLQSNNGNVNSIPLNTSNELDLQFST